MKSFMNESKSRAMGLFWVTARQVVWRTQPNNPAAGTVEKKEESKRKEDHDHPRR